MAVGIALASLIVAILALVIALVSAGYARRQAAAAEGVLSIERDRRFEERLPQFSAKVRRTGVRGAELVVTLESSEALKRLEFTIPPGQGASLYQYQLGVFASRDSKNRMRAFSYIGYEDPGANDRKKGMEPRETMTWEIDLAEDHADEIQVEASCYGQRGEKWDAILIEAPVDPDISKTVW